MKQLKKEIKSLIHRGQDKHLRIAVTGLSRSGKTAFITSFVNQLLNANTGAKLPLFSVVRDERLHGAKRTLHRNLIVPRFTYDEGIAKLYQTPPKWPIATKGISEICLELRYRHVSSFMNYFNEDTSLYLEIIDYPGEWLLDLPMLALDYFSWSEKLSQLHDDIDSPAAKKWLMQLESFDPLAAADENLLADIAAAYTEYLHVCKERGECFIQPGRFILPGELLGAPILQFFPLISLHKYNFVTLKQADKKTNIGLLTARYNQYCQKIVKQFYKDYFSKFDRQIVLVDCLSALNKGHKGFQDMKHALTQIMQSFHYGKRTLLRRLFSPRIDKLLFAVTKVDHVTSDQHVNLISLLQQLINESWQYAAFEGIQIDCMALAAIRATESGTIVQDGEKIPILKGVPLNQQKPIVVYPGTIPSHLPSVDFWQKQSFSFEEFNPLPIAQDVSLPHIRMSAVLEFLLGDKLK